MLSEMGYLVVQSWSLVLFEESFPLFCLAFCSSSMSMDNFFRVVYNIPTDNFVQVHVICFFHLSLSKFVDVYIYPYALISLIWLFVCSRFPFASLLMMPIT